jgi:hypothetical protein
MTLTLRPVKERDAALRDHLESTLWFDAEKDELYDPGPVTAGGKDSTRAHPPLDHEERER